MNKLLFLCFIVPFLVNVAEFRQPQNATSTQGKLQPFKPSNQKVKALVTYLISQKFRKQVGFAVQSREFQTLANLTTKDLKGDVVRVAELMVAKGASVEKIVKSWFKKPVSTKGNIFFGVALLRDIAVKLGAKGLIATIEEIKRNPKGKEALLSVYNSPQAEVILNQMKKALGYKG